MSAAFGFCLVLSGLFAIVSTCGFLLPEEITFPMALPVLSLASLRFLPILGVGMLPMNIARWLFGLVFSPFLFIVPYPTTLFLVLLFFLLVVVMPSVLSPEHQALFSEIAPHIIDLMDARLTGAIDERLRAELVDTNQVFITRFNLNIACWQTTTLPAILSSALAGHSALHRPEPAILNVSFTGSHYQLLHFVHVVRDTFSRHPHSFPDDASRIKWVARHFVPVL